MDFNEVALTEISLDGYQLVKGRTIQKLLEPQMTIRASNVHFNCVSFEALGKCDTIHILINHERKRIVIMPISSSDPDAIRWAGNGKKPKSKPIECTSLTSKLYTAWRWKTENRYKAIGKQVTCDGKVMLMFDFANPIILTPEDKFKK